MDNAQFIECIRKRGISVFTNEPMSRHTTFKTGGGADVFISVKTEEELLFSVSAAKKENLPCLVIGKGSDLLVSDKGVEGAVITLCEMKGISISGQSAAVSAGQSMQTFCLELQRAGLSGLEFAYGIPGTVGGAVYMNAGAYGGEISEKIVSVRYLDKTGEIKEIKKTDMKFGYRHSIFQENGGIILSAVFELQKDEPEKILKQMNAYLARRKDKQPLEFPSAGSVFKRPEGNFAGALIEKSGLKGERCGGALVSEKHAGFIVNTGGATSEDVKKLIKRIQAKVYADSGIKLEPEVIFIGR
ncbi:MAG: UDP-N-acetylmuramate dehydrogenase [Clostridia bacterium]|nr:UDP-N-acetylmuramate dehydrogenase [Clostridia bacterium]